MSKAIAVFCFLVTLTLWAENLEIPASKPNVITSIKRIELEGFPGAFNPSILKVPEGFILTFRSTPNLYFEPWLNFIGIVLLNDSFEPISVPQLLNTRSKISTTPSQSEDARIFSYKGRTYLIYNDNVDITYPKTWQRRDMFLSELLFEGGRFTLSAPIKLCYEEKYYSQWWQKNWMPFEWNKTLLLAYTVNPHEILFLNFMGGSCYRCYETWAPLDWEYGTLRGSTPPLLVDDEYLAFFHSGTVLASPLTGGDDLWHYFMGAYTFSKDPPFAITKVTPKPLVADGFYTASGCEKRVIFPGGYALCGNTIYLAYGKDDCEIWIATIDKDALKKELHEINHQN